MKKIVIMMALAIVCTVSLAALSGIGSLNAEEAGNVALSSKLNDVIENQKVILQKLDDMAEQIQIVKIRATR